MFKEKKDTCITLYSDWEKPIGACVVYEPSGYKCNYDGYMLLSTLGYISDMIVNYNRYLASVSYKIPQEIFVLRFFEALPLDRSNVCIVPSQTRQTEIMLEKYRKDYSVFGTMKNSSIIALNLNEADDYRRHTFFNVSIYLNHWYISTNNFWKITDENGFLRYRHLPNNTKIVRENFDNFFGYFNFNDIEDVITRAENNRDGFLNSDGRIIVME